VPRRKKAHEEHENLERWLVSYADFVTLLFAFFVVMYAVSSVNEGKYRVLSETLTDAFREPAKHSEPVPVGETPRTLVPLEGAMAPATGTPTTEPATSVAEVSAPTNDPGTAADGPKIEDLGKLSRVLEKSLKLFVDERLVDISQVGDTIEIQMKSQMLFDSGSARLAPSAFGVLESVGSILAPVANGIRVEGHTDNVPISTLQFPSNWELSAARAASVVHFLMRLGVAPSRLAAIGYGEHRPVADNGRDDGRQRNRRVTIVVQGASAEIPQSVARP
jgi:chemotaxis protein MotB